MSPTRNHSRRRLLFIAIVAFCVLVFLVVIFQAQIAGLLSVLERGNLDEEFQTWLDQGRELRSRRLFDEAIASFDRILQIDPLHEEATFELADTYFQARRWVEAMDWFYAVSLLNPQRREAFSRRWTAILKQAQSDSLLEKAARGAVRREIADFLQTYPWDWETFSTARQGAILIEDSLLTEELTWRLLEHYPNTPAGYSIISEQFYQGLYPIWNDASQWPSYLRTFLAEHPKSEFREKVWLHLVHALNQTGDLEALRATLNDWMAEDSENPLPYERAVYYLMDRGVSADSLLPLARRAVDKCRGWRGKPLKHVEQRIMEGKTLYAGTRLNIARALLALDRRAEARLWLQDGLKHSGFGVDDEGTSAPFEYFLGVIAEEDGHLEEAFDHFVQALRQGDVQGQWTARADSAASAFFERHLSQTESDPLSLARRLLQYDGPVFEDATADLGLGGVKASRVAWGDANGDGFDDLLLGGWRLFINRNGTRFVEVTSECGLVGEGLRGGVWADVDLDGDLDLFCAGGAGVSDRLYLNRGSDPGGLPQFRDVTERCGDFGDDFPTEGAAWGDLQGDGRPDLYVANYERPGSEETQGTPDYFYVNQPDPGSPLGFRFQRLGPDSGLVPPFGDNLCGRGVNWGDFDGDGDLDIYVSNYRLQENLLWENCGEDGLLDQACYYGIAGRDKDGWWGHTIGSEWGDFDNDGDLDLITANLAHPRHIEYSDRTCLYENRLDQDETFKEVRREWGIKYSETHSDPAWGDVDADGDLDLYLTSIYENRRSFLYLNDLAHHRFVDATYLAGVRVSNAWGCAFSDFDNDGDLDLAVGSSDGVRLFRNRGTKHHWLELDVQVPGSGYGAKVTLKRGDEVQLRQIQGGKGTTSQHSRVFYFGLGQNDAPVDLEVRFLSGQWAMWDKVTLDQKLIIREQ